MIGRLQDLIKESSSMIVTSNKSENKETNKKLDLINQIDNEFKDKSDKIKVKILFFIFYFLLIYFLLISYKIFRKQRKHFMRNLG